MKKEKFLLLFAFTLSILGCKTDFNTEDTVTSETTEIETNADRACIKNLLAETSISLSDGVSIADLGISIDERTEMLIDKLNEKTGKYVYANEEMIKEDDLLQIIEKKKTELNIPNFEDLEESDLAKIQQKFPDLSQDQILNNIETISLIYQDELSALIFDDIIAKSNAKGYDEPYQNSDRGLWRKGKKLWDRIRGKTKKAGETVVNTVKSIEIKDNFRALKIFDDAITVYEVSAILKHPFNAVKLNKAKEKAYNLTKEYMGSDTDTRNKVDAFRHAIFAIVLAKEASGTKHEKIKWSRDFCDAHEKGYKYTEYSSEMDCHNNEVGLRYYTNTAVRKFKQLLFFKIEKSPEEPSYTECCQYIKQKTESAVFIDENLEFSKFKEKISNLDADTLVWIEEK